MLKVRTDGSEAWLNGKKIELTFSEKYDLNCLVLARKIFNPFAAPAEPKLPEPAAQEDKKEGG